MALNPRRSGLLDGVRARGTMTVEAWPPASTAARAWGSTTENITYRQRQQLHAPGELRIARAVARAVPEGCSLILDIELARLDRIDRLYTDAPPPAPFEALLADADVQCIVAGF